MSQKLSRRAAITALATGAATLPAIAVASAAPTDPIFAAIEVHRTAHTNEFSEVITSREQEVRLGAISATAYKSFRDTDPTTLKGHAEKFAYVLEREETFMSDDGVTYEAFASVLRSMQKFAA